MPRKDDLIAAGVLTGLVILVFGLPGMLGHPVLPGDDMTQNYPLRVIAGREIRAGHLPLYNPYIWSGAPLLADWNAGAAYPLTWVFAVLPGIAAWTFGLVVTYAVAAITMFGFLRGLRIRTMAALAGALTFAFGGAMAAQVTHFGLVAGMSWVPLALHAVTRLSAPGGARRTSSRSRLGWTAVLGLTVALIILAGEPRAIADGFVVIALYAAWRLARLLAPGRARTPRGSARWPSVACLAGGAVLGVALSAIQWLPGLAVIGTSQRAGSSLELFSSGSLPYRWLLLMLVPDLLGGSGTWTQPSFFASYNLTEVTGYAGILPLVAAFALLARLPARELLGWLAPRRLAPRRLAPRRLAPSRPAPRHRARARRGDMAPGDGMAANFGITTGGGLSASGGLSARRLARRARPWVPEWLAWHVMALVGVALALGGNTPLGPVLAQLPFYGTQRLQSRNILVLDVALAVLLAYWADEPFPERVRRLARRVPLDAVLGALPAIAIVAIVAGAAWGTGLVRWLAGIAGPGAQVIGALRQWLIPFGVLGVLAVALVWAGRRLPRRVWSRLIIGFVVIDVIVVFTSLAVVKVAPRPMSAGTATAGTATAGTATAGSGAAAAPRAAAAAVPHLTIRPIAALGYPGRFAIYDPDQLNLGQLTALGPPDLNSLTRTPSVQGYTSLVDGRYAAATGSHMSTGQGQNVLSPAAVGGQTLDALDTTSLLTLPVYADGDLRDVLVPPHWVLTGYDGPFAIYRNTRARGPLTLSALHGGTLAGSSVSNVSGPAASPARAMVSSPAGVRVVRSVAAIPGWTATWRPASGRLVTLPVRVDGVIQAVDVPAGIGMLTWHYAPPRLAAGLGVSVTALVALLLLCGAALTWSRDRAGVSLRWNRVPREVPARGDLAA
jgi:hypothetical protein